MKRCTAVSYLGFLLIALLNTAIANAAMISYTTDFDVRIRASENIGATTGSRFDSSSSDRADITLDRFDNSLGTLTGVDISFTSNWRHRSRVSANDQIHQTVSFGDKYANDTWVKGDSIARFTIALDDPAASSLVVEDSFHDECSYGYSHSSVKLTTRCSDSSSNEQSFDGSLDLTAFTLSDFISGDDPLDLYVRTYASIRGTCDNNDSGDTCNGNNRTNWTGTVTVTYTYEEPAVVVPLPGAILLFASALLTLVAARKRPRL